MDDQEFKYKELTSEEIDLDLGIVELIKRINNIIEGLEKRKSEYEEELKNEKSEYIIKELKNDSKKINNEIELHNNEIMFLNDYKKKYKKYDELLNKENDNKSLKDIRYNKLLNDKEQCERTLKDEKSNYIINNLKTDLGKIDKEIDDIKKDIERINEEIGKILSKLNKDKDEFKIICDKYKFKITDYKKNIINSNTQNKDNNDTYQNGSNEEESKVEMPYFEEPPVEEKLEEEKPEEEKPEEEKTEEEKTEEEKTEEEKTEEEPKVEVPDFEETPVEETPVTKNESDILVLQYDEPNKNLLVLNSSDLLLSLNLKDLEWSKKLEGTIKLDKDKILRVIIDKLIDKLDVKYIGYRLDDSNLVKNSNLFADIQDYLNSQNKSGNVNGSKTSKASDHTINGYSNSFEEKIKILNEYIENSSISYDDIEKLYRELLIDKDKLSNNEIKILNKAQMCLTQNTKILNMVIQEPSIKDGNQNISIKFTCDDINSKKRTIKMNLILNNGSSYSQVIENQKKIEELGKCYFDLARAVKNSKCSFEELNIQKQKLKDAIEKCKMINGEDLINTTHVEECLREKKFEKIVLNTEIFYNEPSVTSIYNDKYTFDGQRESTKSYNLNNLNVKKIKEEIKNKYIDKDYSKKEINQVLNAINPLIIKTLKNEEEPIDDYVSSVKEYVLKKEGKLPFEIEQDLTKVRGKIGKIFNKSAKGISGMEKANVKYREGILDKIKNIFKKKSVVLLNSSNEETNNSANKQFRHTHKASSVTEKENLNNPGVNKKKDDVLR